MAGLQHELQVAWKKIHDAARYEISPTVNQLVDRQMRPVGYQCQTNARIQIREDGFIFVRFSITPIYDPYGGGTEVVEPDDPRYEKALAQALAAVEGYLGVKVYRSTEERDAWKANLQFTPPGHHNLTAATVGTDTASIYAIAPEQLMHVIDEGLWKAVWFKGDYARADQLIRQHGGAVFHLGADGTSEILMPGAEEVGGALYPYGTEDFTTEFFTRQRVARRYLRKLAAR